MEYYLFLLMQCVAERKIRKDRALALGRCLLGPKLDQAPKLSSHNKQIYRKLKETIKKLKCLGY